MPDGVIVIPRKEGYLGINYILQHHQQQQQEEIKVPLIADVTTANVQDNKMYIPLTSYHSPFSAFSLPLVCYMVADPGYDDKKLYEYSKKTLGIDLVCPLLKDTKTFPRRGLRLYAFFNQYWDRQYTAREGYR